MGRVAGIEYHVDKRVLFGFALTGSLSKQFKQLSRAQ
jgi:hypothetical protein